MNGAAAPPPPEEKPATLSLPSNAILGGLAVLPILFLIFFHAGAGYLSYQKFGSMGWAILDFFFAYFYYPYYAFFLTGSSMEAAPINTMMGGFKKLFGGRRR